MLAIRKQSLRITADRPPRRWQVVLLLLGVLVLASGGQLNPASAGASPVDAVGRLIVDNTGLCTAFVVRSIERQALSRSYGRVTMYENWLVSAGHCLGSKLVFSQQGTLHEVAGIVGFSSGGERGHDVMVAAFFTDHPMPTLEPAFGEYPRAGDTLMLIGYGRKALMMRVGPVVGYDERGDMVIENFASPGNSGGPVLIPGTRRVVGVGIEATLDLRPGVPVFFCRIGPCGVKPPYIATPIDRLLGVASFRDLVASHDTP